MSKLRDADIRNVGVAEGKKSTKLFDGGGLFLYVTHSGRHWRLKYRHQGKERLHSIGPYPLVSLKEARHKAMEIKRLLLDGQDPALQKQRQQQEVMAAQSMQHWAERWFESYRNSVNAKTGQLTWTMVTRCILPALGKRTVGELSTLDIVEHVRTIERQRSPRTAIRTLQFLSAILGYVAQSGVIPVNPAAQLGGIIPEPPVEHRKAMLVRDIPAFLAELESPQFGFWSTTKDALALVVLTMLRSGEVTGGRWSEIDFEAAEWRIPPERMKMSREHIVPLSRQAMAILQARYQKRSPSPFVFPGRKLPFDSHLHTCVLSRAMIDMGYKGQATVHGFRATASTALNEQGFNPDAIELQLSHVERNKVRATYNRALRLQERREMLQWWADTIMPE